MPASYSTETRAQLLTNEKHPPLQQKKLRFVWGQHLEVDKYMHDLPCLVTHTQHTIKTSGCLVFVIEAMLGLLSKTRTQMRVMMLIRNHVETFRKLKAFGTILNHSKPFQTIWNHFEPFQIIWNHLELFGTIWNHLEPFVTICNHLEPFGTF